MSTGPRQLLGYKQAALTQLEVAKAVNDCFCHRYPTKEALSIQALNRLAATGRHLEKAICFFKSAIIFYSFQI
ncbi:hypothetical protein T4A_12227 [Trichinella pseudospiralis]|uniref:Uncharacterized protein n=1 Tax=Trichinella pseudospiralis TaxID=6337 RepID=A0A0V1ESY8_TRIPS|nr:hypothetical protein T4E_10669 [Trichinella pseudospiralis]KRY76936.1 hypothetical protein T4A_12227 [Trichinella pseudospiralis]KRY93178.1 hypothetical protein T4D_13474 [Trichinella pseudospiralis]